MATYRYPADAVESITRNAANRSSITVGVALFVGVVIALWNVDLRQPLLLVLVLASMVAALFWSRWRIAQKLREGVRSLEFELDGDELSGRGARTSTTIRREEVTRLRYMKDGILVSARNPRRTLHVKSALAQYDELASMIEQWAPAGVSRIRSSTSFASWVTLAIFANIGLLFVGALVEKPVIAIPCCVAEAIILVGCVVFVWRSKAAERRLKWQVLIAVVPAISLLARAWSLFKHP